MSSTMLCPLKITFISSLPISLVGLVFHKLLTADNYHIHGMGAQKNIKLWIFHQNPRNTHHLSNRQRNKELSTEAHALRISGNIPHKAVPSPPAALYLSISTGGNSQVSTTSTKGGHCNEFNPTLEWNGDESKKLISNHPRYLQRCTLPSKYQIVNIKSKQTSMRNKWIQLHADNNANTQKLFHSNQWDHKPYPHSLRLKLLAYKWAAKVFLGTSCQKEESHLILLNLTQ